MQPSPATSKHWILTKADEHMVANVVCQLQSAVSAHLHFHPLYELSTADTLLLELSVQWGRVIIRYMEKGDKVKVTTAHQHCFSPLSTQVLLPATEHTLLCRSITAVKVHAGPCSSILAIPPILFEDI